jgi:hypothetical protein
MMRESIEAVNVKVYQKCEWAGAYFGYRAFVRPHACNVEYVNGCLNENNLRNP